MAESKKILCYGRGKSRLRGFTALLYFTGIFCSKKSKATIIGALGYFISPFDALIDLTPIVGYTDDLGVLLLALGVAALYINDHVKAKARKKLCELFGETPTHK